MSKTKKIPVELVENRLIAWNPEEGSKLYGLGFYGKPVGIPKPKSAEFDSPLIIDLIEGLYLLEQGEIKVYSGDKKESMGTKKLWKYARKVYEGFDLNYQVYKDLREHNYIVLPGIKFGCEFAVYEKGPGVDHAPYLVSVKGLGEEITSTDVVRAGRLATSVRKRFIIAVPNPKTNKIQYLMFNWYKA
ncbi:MAG: tRNA-intron endonuclease, archaea type [Thermoproteota archaeon]|nr:tRNA-intron endonuclease, archaea type [Thermoproteota archaeon]